MEELGQTTAILNRFPNFFDAANTESLFYQFVDVFSEILEAAETDLLRVMRAHHVDTADNYGSQGLDARQKGDLDRIFALYLEKLGGTSQLTQINHDLKATDIKNISAFVKQLIQANDSVSKYIRSNKEVNKIIKSYDVNNIQFKAEDFLKADSLVIKLIICKDAVTLYLQKQFSDETKQRLNTYNGAKNIPQELTDYLTQQFNKIMENCQLYKKFQERSVQVDLAKQLDNLLNEYSENQLKNEIITNLAQILRRRLSLNLQNPLYRQTNQQLTPEFWRAVFQELKEELKKVSFCQQLLTLIKELENNYPATNTQISAEFVALLKQASEALRELLGVESIDKLQKAILSEQAKSLLTGAKINDNIKRGNRLLLETVYPDEIRKSQIPEETLVTEALVSLLNEKILPDSNFYPDNKDYFDRLMLDLEAQKLIQKQQKRENFTENQLKCLNRLLLESAYPLYLHKNHDPYRERLKALINVMRKGAATKEGIRDIVAANLGIFNDNAEAVEAKKKIIIEEYAPEAQKFPFTWVYPNKEEKNNALTKPPWKIRNPNPIETTPDCIQVRILDIRSKNETDKTNYLIKPRLINSQTKQVIEIINDEKNEIRLKKDDVLEFDSDGTIKVNGTVRTGVKCKLVPLVLGESQWYFDADIQEPAAKFDNGVFDLSKFDNNENTQSSIQQKINIEETVAKFDSGIFDSSTFSSSKDTQNSIKQQAVTVEVQVEWCITKQTPGIFHAIVPWHIKGFTDKFAEAEDHPRSQIAAIVNRVKAAGVKAVISYQQEFTEIHEIGDRLILQGERIWNEQQPQQHSNLKFSSEQSLTEVQEMSDSITFSGVFDFTEFDSDNLFN